MKLKDKVAFVIGGGSGIGRAIALAFANNGANVIIAGRRVQKLKETAAEAAGSDLVIDIYKLDATVLAETKKVVGKIVTRFKRIDILVVSAGFAKVGNIVTTTEKDWDMMMDLNLKTAFNACKCVVPDMQHRGGGSIILIGSIFGLRGKKDRIAYCSAKGALANFTRALALDHAHENIRVNSICPGFVETEMAMAIVKNAKDPSSALAERHAWHPMGRGGKPEEVAGVALFLASDAAKWITGINLSVDGGYSAK